MTCHGCGPFQSVIATSVGLADGDQPLPDKLVLLQHLGDGPKNCKLGLSRTGDTFPGKERGIKYLGSLGTEDTMYTCVCMVDEDE